LLQCSEIMSPFMGQCNIRFWNRKILQTLRLSIRLLADLWDPNVILLGDMSVWWIYVRFCYQINIYGLLSTCMNMDIYPDRHVQTSVQLLISSQNYSCAIILTYIVFVTLYSSICHAILRDHKYNSFPAISKFVGSAAVGTHPTETKIYG
jgi:hypothetical protein